MPVRKSIRKPRKSVRKSIRKSVRKSKKISRKSLRKSPIKFKAYNSPPRTSRRTSRRSPSPIAHAMRPITVYIPRDEPQVHRRNLPGRRPNLPAIFATREALDMIRF